MHKNHAAATALIVGGIGGRTAFLPDKYYEKIDPEFRGKPRDSVMFKMIVVEEGGEFPHVFGVSPVAMDVARYRAMLVATAGDWKWTDTLMKRVNGGDGSSGFELERRKKTPKPKVAPTIEAASMSPPSTPPSPSPRSLDPCLCGGCNLSEPQEMRKVQEAGVLLGNLQGKIGGGIKSNASQLDNVGPRSFAIPAA